MRRVVFIFKRLALYLTIAALGFVVGAVALYIYWVRSGPSFEIWHTEELTAEFRDLTESDAQLIRDLAEAVIDCDPDEDPLEALIDSDSRLESTERYVRSLHSSPYYSDIWRVAVALHAIDTLIGTHGVESFGGDPNTCVDPPTHEYCNAGDPYAATLIYEVASGELFIGCWGDLAE